MLIEKPNNEDEEGEKQPERDPETETEVAEPSTEEEDAAVGPVQQMELKKIDSQELEDIQKERERNGEALSEALKEYLYHCAPAVCPFNGCRAA